MASLSFHEENTQVCDAEITQPLVSYWESNMILPMVPKIEDMYEMNQLWSFKLDFGLRWKNL